MAMTVIEILERCPLFSRVPAASLARLVQMGRVVRFRKGQAIFHEGEPCPGMYIIGVGSVRIFKAAPSGREVVLHFAGPGQTFAEVAAMADFALPASAEAMAPTTCALLPAEPFRRALGEDHQLCLGLLQGMAGWVRSLVGLIEDIVLRDALGRLARFLLELPADPENRVILPALRRHVASRLNLTSETLSRCMRRLEEAGLILPMGARCIRLLGRKGLEQIANQLTPHF
ncbi:MAG: Crp/Fnr family transcriptional regulator [Thermoguttaceae bacterium]|nr:Crp/Fnr family transcriptional regulator [Thermoguttaceae bacterium]MDW8079412.1 Crp/Fnr family transcriptional regulator [Thermoguttaceae bacterium]